MAKQVTGNEAQFNEKVTFLNDIQVSGYINKTSGITTTGGDLYAGGDLYVKGNLIGTTEKGQKGEVGQKGQKGEIGQKGDKGQKGEKGEKGDKGQKGIAGSFGGAGFTYDFSTDTANTDPGIGNLKFNNATLASATQMYIDDSDSNGDDISSFIATIDDSDSAIKGHFKVSLVSNVSEFALYTINNTSTDNGGYFTIPCAYVAGDIAGGTFPNNDGLSITFARTGDVGDKGQKGEVGEKGQKGEVGEKGQKGEVGQKGQKGEVGQKGQKGEVGQKGQKGDKGQKGEQATSKVHAWAVFDGAGTSGSAQVQNSYNVSSVAVNGEGNFTISYSTSTGTTNYIVTGNSYNSGAGTNAWATRVIHPSNNYTTGSIQVFQSNLGSSGKSTRASVLITV
jgi:hypothetical protein